MDLSGGPGKGSSTREDESDAEAPQGRAASPTVKGKAISDAWCAVSSASTHHASPSSVPIGPSSSAAAADLAALWQGAGAGAGEAVGCDDVERDPEADVSWCDDDEPEHSGSRANFLSSMGSSAFPDSSTGSIPRFKMDSNLCNMTGQDLEASCSAPDDHYQQFPLPGLGMLGRQESLELLAESFAQFVPTGEIDKYSQDDLRLFQEDLEQFLFDPGDALLLPPPPPPQQLPLLDHLLMPPETPNDSETMSSSVSIGDTEGEFRDSDAAVVTSSGESLEGSMQQQNRQPAGVLKRKERVRESAAGAARETSDGARESQLAQPQAQQLSIVDTLQKKLKGPERGPEQAAPPLTTRPRYAIQTRTEVDVIDDGYRWRKYGQKPVKNSAHPRNYYRCTTPNCPVRKRVERSTENPSHVLTTYDGTHTHPETAANHSQGREANPPAATAGNVAADAPLPAPGSPVSPSVGPWPAPPGPPRLPPSNYIAPNIISHLLAAGAAVPAQRWRGPAPPHGGSFFQRNLNLLKAHQFFRLQYGTQYPLLASMLNLMRSFPQARPPVTPRFDPRLDPRMDPRMDPMATLMAARSFQAMRSGQVPDASMGNAGRAMEQPQPCHGGMNVASPGVTPSAPVLPSSAGGPGSGGRSTGPMSMQQQRLLWMQALMGEALRSEEGWAVQQAGQDAEDNQDDAGGPA